MKGILLIATASFFWAIDTLIRYPLVENGIDPIRIVFTEHLILVTVFIPFYLKNLKKFWNTSIAQYFYLFIVGGLGSALATFWFTSAFQYLNPSIVILLQKFQPIFAILLARIVLKEKTNHKFLLWALICFIGGLLISYPDLIQFQGLVESGQWKTSGLSLGYLFTLMAAASWGATTVFGKKLSENFSEIEIMGGRYLFGLIVAAGLLGLNQTLVFDLSTQVYGKILLMVVIVGLLSMYIYYKGLRLIPAKLCTLAEMFFPFCAVAVNWIFLDKVLLFPQIMGGIILLIGSTVIQLKRY